MNSGTISRLLSSPFEPLSCLREIYGNVEDHQSHSDDPTEEQVCERDRLLLREELAHNERTQRERNRLARPEEQEKQVRQIEQRLEATSRAQVH